MISSQVNCKPGTRIHGKWLRNEWVIKRKIGAGEVGVVYEVEGASGRAALKFASAAAVASETRALEAVIQSSRSSKGAVPGLIEVDDATGSFGSYYVMEYVEGVTIEPFIKQHGIRWITVVLIWLLSLVTIIHQTGRVVGDIKPDNFIVQARQKRTCLIDTGGMTLFGRSVKEYTALYDRGTWRAGTRKAEPAYDLFGIAVLIIVLTHKQSVLKFMGDKSALLHILSQSEPLSFMAPVLKKALQSEYKEAVHMKRDLLRQLQKQQSAKQNSRTGRFLFWSAAVCAALVSFILLY